MSTEPDDLKALTDLIASARPMRITDTNVLVIHTVQSLRSTTAKKITDTFEKYRNHLPINLLLVLDCGLTLSTIPEDQILSIADRIRRNRRERTKDSQCITKR